MKKLFALMACSMMFACVACDDSNDSSKAKECTRKSDCAQNEVCITGQNEVLAEAGKTETPKANAKKGTCKADNAKDCAKDDDCKGNATLKTCVKTNPNDKGKCGVKVVDDAKKCTKDADCQNNATLKMCKIDAGKTEGVCSKAETTTDECNATDKKLACLDRTDGKTFCKGTKCETPTEDTVTDCTKDNDKVCKANKEKTFCKIEGNQNAGKCEKPAA